MAEANSSKLIPAKIISTKSDLTTSVMNYNLTSDFLWVEKTGVAKSNSRIYRFKNWNLEAKRHVNMENLINNEFGIWELIFILINAMKIKCIQYFDDIAII